MQRKTDSDQNEKNDEIIESASATTSSDNSNSGPFAYIITGVALAVVLVMTMVGAGCAAVAFTAAAHYDPSDYDLDAYEHLLDEDMDFDEWLELYSTPNGGVGGVGSHGNAGNPGNSGNDSSGSVSVDEALDFDIAPFSTSINDAVSASSYAGATEGVYNFVRELLARDNEFTTRVSQCLDTAALNEDQRAEKIAEAKAVCDEAHQAMVDFALPDLPEDEHGEVKDLLGTAKTNAERRWELMANEIDLFTGDTVQKDRLWEVDDSIVSATYDAGNNLVDAMARSAAR